MTVPVYGFDCRRCGKSWSSRRHWLSVVKAVTHRWFGCHD